MAPGEADLTAILNAPENETPEQKLDALKTKFLQKASAHKKALAEHKLRNDSLFKEKSALVNDYAKVTAVKDKLEQLCRELQKANKNVIEDSRNSAVEEASKREQLSAKFEGGIKDISARLEEHGEERMKALKENDELRDQLGNLAERAKLQAEHHEKCQLTFDLEKQLLEARLAEAEARGAQSEEKSEVLSEKVKLHVAREEELTAQLAAYGEKFGQFQEMIQSSNEAFTSFKGEMERLTKALKKAEKEKGELLAKVEKSDVAMIQLLEERVASTKGEQKLRQQNDKLQALCRTLQARLKDSGTGDKAGTQTGTVDAEEAPPAPQTPA